MERSRQNQQQHSKSLNASYELPMQQSAKRGSSGAQQKVKSGRSDSQTHQNQNNAYMENSFHIQRESLQNLQEENEQELLRERIPPQSSFYEDIDQIAGPHEVDVYDKEDNLISPINEIEAQTKIDNLNFEVQINSIVRRIKEHTALIKEKVNSQKEISKSFIQVDNDEDFENEDGTKEFQILSDQENSLDVSAIMLKPQNNKSQSFIADNSYLMNHATASFQPGNLDQHYPGENSFLLSPNSYQHREGIKIYGDESQIDITMEQIKDENQEDENITLPKEILQKIIDDLKTKHQSEVHTLQSEITVFKKVIHLMGYKIKNLQGQMFEKDSLKLNLFKQKHQNEKLKAENTKLKNENKNFKQRLDITKRVMYEFDLQNIEDQTADNYLLEQLIRENHHLQRLLLISDTHGQKDFTSIEEQLRFLENQTVNMMSIQSEPIESKFGSTRKSSSIGYYSSKKMKSMDKCPQPFSIPEPQGQQMTGDVKMHIKDRQLMKEDERRIKQEMRMIAEEEIMREMRMAQEYFMASEFQKTGKYSQQYYEEGHDNSGHQEESIQHQMHQQHQEEEEFERAGSEQQEDQQHQQYEHEETENQQIYERNLNTPEKEQEEESQENEAETQNEQSPAEDNVFSKNLTEIEEENKVGNEQR